MSSVKQELLKSLEAENNFLGYELFLIENIRKARLPKALALAALHLSQLSLTPQDSDIIDHIETKDYSGKKPPIAEELILVLNHREPGF